MTTRNKVRLQAGILILFLAGIAQGIFAQDKYVWDSVRIGGGGFVSGIVTSAQEKDLIYIRTDVGGAYRWDAEGKSWKALTDWINEDTMGWMGIESIAIDPQAPNRVYMLAGTSYFSGGRTAIFRSENRGESFEVVEVTDQIRAHGNGMGRQTGEKLVVDPHNSKVLLCGSRTTGLWRSLDQGKTWSRVDSLDVKETPNGNGISFVCFDPDSPVKNGRTQTIFAGISRAADYLFVSHDGGDSWQKLDPDADMSAMLDGEMPARGKIAAGTLYLTLGNGAGPHGSADIKTEVMDQGAVWTWKIKEQQWKDISPDYRAMGGISIDPKNPLRLVCSTINTWKNQGGASGDMIYVSDDGGESWRNVFDSWTEKDKNGITWVAGHSIHWAGSIEFDPFNTKRVFVVSGNGLWATEDIDAKNVTWIFQSRGLEETVPLDMVSIAGGPALSVIGDYDGFVHADPHAYGPIHNPQIGTSTGLAWAGLKPNVVVRLGGDDKGRNFPLWYSTDMAKTWTKFKLKPPVKTPWKGKVAISADGTTVLWTPEREKQVWRTSDWGQTWTASKGPNNLGLVPVADPVNPKVFYIYQPNNGVLWASSDGGMNFVQASKTGRGGSALLRTVPGKEGELWLALRQNGLAHSTDGGKTFVKLSGLEDCSAIGLGKEAPGKTWLTLYMWGTVGKVRGMFRSTDQGQTWVRINDDQHQFGGPGNGGFVLGDLNVYGRVFMSSAGRGIAFGEIKN